MTHRRHFLAGAGALATLAFPGFAFGQARVTDRRLLLVILRGGMDGLSALPPIGDPAYASLRGSLAIPASGEGAALRLDSTFGLHKNLSRMHALYQAGELMPVHACATAYRERSHFDAQNVLETGAGAPFARGDGWLNAALAAMPQSRPEMGMALSAQAPLVLRGPAHVATWSPSALPQLDEGTLGRLMALYQARDPALATALSSAVAANGVAMDAGADGMNARGRSLAPLAQIAARFLKDEHGPIAAVMETTGWDTHANQGLEQGPLARNLAALDEGLDAFKAEMGAAWRNTLVIAVTEFGRTAAPNGGGGTDHGTAAAAFFAGGAVRGGRVLSDWPGLAQRDLYEGRDLRPTLDLRAVLKSALHDHFSLAQSALDGDVFPDSQGVQVIQDLIRS